jgi:hypothetical protein
VAWYISASSRISKGQGYQGFLRKRAGISRLLKENGRYIKASYRKGQGAVLAKKGQFASYKEKLEKFTEFHYF